MGWRFVEVEVEGRNPLGDQATDRFPPLDDELANRCPDRTQQAYPFAYEQVAQLFDHPAAPDLVCLHTAAHNWEDQGGERGEHGSIGVVQARAPFILAGAGVRRSAWCPGPAGSSTWPPPSSRSSAPSPAPAASG